MSLGSILAPIQEFGVGPGQVLSLLRYSIPVALTYVLPMAALFGATLTYGRFASDNELDACRASGVSKMAIIYPAFCLAIAVAIANLLLSFYVVPTYVSKAEHSIRANAKQIVFRSIQRQGYYKSKGSDFTLVADAAIPEKNLLIGVNVIETDNGRSASLTSCENAIVNIDTHKRYNNVTVVATNAYQLDPQGQAFTQELPIKAKLPSLLQDNIKFQKLEKLKEIRLNPVMFEPIREKAYEAYDQITLELLAQDLEINSGKLYQMNNDNSAILFSAGRYDISKGKITLDNKIELYEYSLSEEGAVDKLLRKWSCEAGEIKLENSGPLAKPFIILEGASRKDSDGYVGMATRYSIHGLALPIAIADKLESDNILDSINTNIPTITKPSSSLNGMVVNLNRQILKIYGSIVTEIHSRLVFGVGCVVLILMGAALGIINKGSHLLTGFGISSIPAAALIVFMTMGKNLTKNAVRQQGVTEVSNHGIIIMWLGLALLTLICFWIYRKLLKT